MSYESEKQIAIEAALAAASLCKRVHQEIVPQAIEKNDRSPVTVADFGSQAVICRTIAAAFPNDAIVGEEDAAVLRQPEMTTCLQQVTHYVQTVIPDATPEAVVSWIDRGNGAVTSRYWTLDPIDGTKGFLRQDQYAVAIALIEDGDVKVGVLACPALPVDLSQPTQEQGVLFVAVRGEGAVMMPLQGGEPKPIRVTPPEQGDRLRFVESVESGHGNHALQDAVAKAVGIQAPSIRMDSQAKYGAVAQGEAALYLRLPSPKSPNYREKIWDHAAGVLIVEEAGGQVTDMHGAPLKFSLGSTLEANQGVVVSNGSIHEGVLQVLREHLAPVRD
jgi:3'(2'), 5'-bisphosphate nucleotidase